MGTLLNQPVRNNHSVKGMDVDHLICEIQGFHKITKWPIVDILKVYEILELRRQNDFNVANGDIHDEQMAGFGEIMQEIDGSLDRIATALNIK